MPVLPVLFYFFCEQPLLVVLMKGLLAALAVVSALFLLLGCASTQQQAGGNNQDQGAGAGTITDKVILAVPPVLPGGKVGKPYEYSFCDPKPSGKSGLCGGINPISNPRGGKGPYSFYLGSGTGFPQTGLSLNLNGILSGIPAATGTRLFNVCAKDIGGDYGCEDVSLTITDEPAGLAGVWELTAHSLMNGPEGSFPAGCSMEQKFQLNLTQNGNVVGGIATNRLTKTTGCGIWSVDIQTPDKMQVSGSISAPSVTFTIGNIDFTGTIAWNNMTGTMATCRSPDPKCTSSGLQQLNWYSGDFIAVKAG